MLTWHQRYRIRNFLKASIWFLPTLCMLAAMVAARLLVALDRHMGWDAGLDPDAIRVVIATLAGSMLSFIVFVFTMLLVVAQLASAQLTPRIIATALQNRITKLALCAFVFTFAYSLALVARIVDTVPAAAAWTATVLNVLSLVFFLLLIDLVISQVRPVRQLVRVAAAGRRVIDAVYPQRLQEAGGMEAPAPVQPARTADAVVFEQHTDGVFLAFDPAGLVALARRADCVVEIVPRVGDFVARGAPLFRVRGGALQWRDLRRCVVFGPERTMEQDPLFAFRIIVDVACKALSPAVNDPTTAVLALDQLHHMLRMVAMRRLDTGNVVDADGRLRLVSRTPDWKDFVGLAITEIRLYGKDSIQVARRLRSLLENLISLLPAERSERLVRELDLLKRSVQRGFLEAEDRELADRGDAQGLGGD